MKKKKRRAGKIKTAPTQTMKPKIFDYEAPLKINDTVIIFGFREHLRTLLASAEISDGLAYQLTVALHDGIEKAKAYKRDIRYYPPKNIITTDIFPFLNLFGSGKKGRKKGGRSMAKTKKGGKKKGC